MEKDRKLKLKNLNLKKRKSILKRDEKTPLENKVRALCKRRTSYCFNEDLCQMGRLIDSL